MGTEEFTTSHAGYLDQQPGADSSSARIFVKVRLAEVEAAFVAMLDTGAAWSVFPSELMGSIGDFEAIAETTLSTRLGKIKGHLVRIPLTLLADQGESLTLDATVFRPLAGEWPEDQFFLGYTCCLDRIRMAIDPSVNQFHFGPMPN